MSANQTESDWQRVVAWAQCQNLSPEYVMRAVTEQQRKDHQAQLELKFGEDREADLKQYGQEQLKFG